MPQNRRVLVVEDDQCLTNAITRCLRSLDRSATIEWVSSVEDAEEHLKKWPFDLIVADHTLCGFRTGIDLWEHCKRNCPRVPFVMISGLPVTEFLTKMGPKSTLPFLPKPFSTEEFSELVKEYL